MKTVALISGGKDSCFNMMCCVAEGHEIVALANLRPEKENQHELDSYMFQTVGHTAIDLYAEAMGLPLYVQSISGSSLATGGDYRPQDGDEVEDLFKLLQAVKDDITIEAVSVGAILSDYQRVRVENVCGRLGLTVLSYLWRRDQTDLLQEMISCEVKAKIIKVAAMGLKPEEHLGLELSEILPHMLNMKSKYGLNVCGEGGEYETFVYDCPLFQQRINIEETEQVIHSDDAFAPVGYLVLKSCSLCPKSTWDPSTPLQQQIGCLPLLTSQKWLASHNLVQPLLDSEVDGPDHPPQAEGGGGDLPAMIMCVPDVPLSGTEVPTFRSDGTNFQVSGVRAIVGQGLDLKQATEMAMNNLKDCLSKHDIKMEEIISVSLCVGDISNFATINSVYKQFFDLNPPVRVCVEASLPRNIALQLDCHGRRSSKPPAGAEGNDEVEEKKKVLHVQALSHWAPANIGPYSQAVVANGKLHMAGIVPLVPATLDLVEGGIDTQSSLALTHVQTVMSVISPGSHLGCCPMVTCYLTREEFIDNARTSWQNALKASLPEDEEITKEKSVLSPRVQFVQVPALPKAALVEWHVQAWPGLEDIKVSEVKEAKQFENHSICAVSQYCVDQPQLFSCHITTEVLSIEKLQRADKSGLPNQLVEMYCHVWKKCFPLGSKESGPLVKVFYSPTVYDFSYIHRHFEEAVASICSSQSVPEPVLSLVPVPGLDSSKQILAWCQ